MGKNKQQHRRHNHGRKGGGGGYDEEDALPSSAFDGPSPSPSPLSKKDEDEEEEEEEEEEGLPQSSLPSKFDLYQRSVQSPKGDISYLQKFFLNYVGGRVPIHLREDFCGTALICSEWVKGGFQRLATGLDLDKEALSWGLKNNIGGLASDACTRVRLYHGNVLDMLSSAELVQMPTFSNSYRDSIRHNTSEDSNEQTGDEWPPADIVCAFNYSCCCLQKRSDLLLYFKRSRNALSKNGGIFVMDVYGGTSSECALKFRRHFGGFDYTWEQEDFDVITRTTRISLHFRMKGNRTLRHAFSYHWRLWSLSELKDCLNEAGFDGVHFWMREMPEIGGKGEGEEIEDNMEIYEESSSFLQKDAWNAYVVAVADKR